MQHVNVLRHGFTQREREAQHDLEITVLKTWLLNSKYCLVYDTIVIMYIIIMLTFLIHVL